MQASCRWPPRRRKSAWAAINQSPLMAGLVILIFAVEQWVESRIFVPFLLGRQVSLHPLIVLLSMMAGASLLGIVGADHCHSAGVKRNVSSRGILPEAAPTG